MLTKEDLVQATGSEACHRVLANLGCTDAVKRCLIDKGKATWLLTDIAAYYAVQGVGGPRFGEHQVWKLEPTGDGGARLSCFEVENTEKIIVRQTYTHVNLTTPIELWVCCEAGDRRVIFFPGEY
jgi:hypothetical protein